MLKIIFGVYAFLCLYLTISGLYNMIKIIKKNYPSNQERSEKASLPTRVVIIILFYFTMLIPVLNLTIYNIISTEEILIKCLKSSKNKS